MTKQRLPLWLMTALLLAGLAIPAEAAAPPKGPSPKVGAPAGSISALLPVARIVRGAGKAAVTSEAKKGDAVVWNDLIKTERGGRARITLADQSILSLGSQAELKIVKHDARTQQTALTLAGGRLRAEVTKIARMGGSFELHTPTAVAGVIGTDFGSDASSVGTTTFLCISGVVQVANVDPAIAGSVQCTPGMTTSVSTGKPPTPPANATPQQIQQLILDTEPALISAMAPSTALPGATVDTVITGNKLAGVKNVHASGGSLTAKIVGTPSDTSVTVQLQIAPSAAPGPRTITLSKQSGAESAAVFTILEDPKQGGGDPKKAYHDLLELERTTTRAGLNAYLLSVQQAIDLANQQLQLNNSGNVDLSKAAAAFGTEYKNAQTAVDAAGTQVDNAVGGAVTAFDGQFTTGDAAPALFQQVNADLAKQFNTIRAGLNSALQMPLGHIADVHQTWMGTISASAKGGPNPNVNSIERNIDLGAAFGGGSIPVLDASNSRAAGGATILGYKWVLCGKEYKPAQFGVPLVANAGGCNPIAGYASASADFAFATCNLEATDYVARLTITDSNNASAAMDVKVHVLGGSYDDPSQRFINLATAYGTLQTQQFLGFFDESLFPGYTSLSENVRKTFPALSTMNINPIVSQSTSQCNDATVRGNWDQNYTYKTSPNLNLNQKEQLEMRLVRTPGKGWFITYFEGDNGTVPGIANVDAGAPDLGVFAVFPTYASAPATSAVPVPPGSQSFTAVVKNEGTADLSASTVVRFTLTSPSGTSTVDAPLPIPLKTGASVPVLGLLAVPPSVGDAFSVTAVVNPDQKVSEPNYANNSGAASLFVGTPVKLAQTSPALSFLPGGPSQTLQISVSDAASVSIVLPAGMTTSSANPQVFAAGGGTATWVLSADFNAKQGSGLTTKISALASGVSVDLPISYSITTVGFTQASPVAMVAGLGGSLGMSVNVPGTFWLTLPKGITTTSPNPQTLTSAGTLSWTLAADYTAAVGTFSGGAGGSSTMLVMAMNGASASTTQSAAAYAVTGASFSQSIAPTLVAGNPATVPLNVNVNSPGPFTITLPAGVSTSVSTTQTAVPITGGYFLSWPIRADVAVAAGAYANISVSAGPFAFQASYTVVGPSMTITPASVALVAGDLTPQTLQLTVSVPGTYTLSLPGGMSSTTSLIFNATGPGTVTWPLTADFSAAAGTFTTASTMTITSGAYTTVVPYSVAAPTFSQSATPTLIAGDLPQILQVSSSVPGLYVLSPPPGVTVSPSSITLTSPGTLTWSLQAGVGATVGSGTAVVTAMIFFGSPSSYTFPASLTINAPALTQIGSTSLVQGGVTQPLTIEINLATPLTGPAPQLALTLPPGITATGCTASPCVKSVTGPSTGPSSATWDLQADTGASVGGSLPILCTLMDGASPSPYSFTAHYAVTSAGFTQRATPNLVAGGSAQTLSVDVTAGGSFSIQTPLPAGITVSPIAPQVLSGSGGVLTWTVQASFAAAQGTGLSLTVVNAAVTNPVSYSVVAPNFTAGTPPLLLSGGSAQLLTVQVDVAGDFKLKLPPSVTTADANPKTAVGTSPPYLLSWNIQAGMSAATGALSATVVAMDGLAESAYSGTAGFSVNGQANYVLTNIAFVGHNSALPYTGANALQTDEDLTITGNVLNVGNTSPVGSITVNAGCTGGANGCGAPTPSSPLSAPTAGDPTGTPFAISFINGLAPGNYTGQITLSTTLPQSSTADDLYECGGSCPGGLPFEDVDFTVAVNQPRFSGAQNILIGSSGQVPVAVTLMGTVTPFAIPVTVSGPYSGVSYSPTVINITPGTDGTFDVQTLPNTPNGPLDVTFRGSNHGVTKTATYPLREAIQPVLFVSEQLVSTSLFLNDSGNPLELQLGNSANPQVVGLQISGDNFFGDADLTPPTSPLGFSGDTGATSTITTGGRFNLNIFASPTATATPTMLTMTATLHNSFPPANIKYDVWVKGIGLPDLEVVSATLGTSFTTADPWIDGEGALLTVLIRNNGAVSSQGGEFVSVELDGHLACSATLPLPIAPGPANAYTLSNVQCVAPDAHGNNNVSGIGTLKIRVEPDAGGDMNYPNNTITQSVPVANWHLAVSGSGTQGSPLSYVLSSVPVPMAVNFAGTIDGASPSKLSGSMVQAAAGQTSTSMTVGSFGAIAGGAFNAQVDVTSTGLQNGQYFAQVIMQVKAFGSVTAQRQATVWVNLNNVIIVGGATAAPALTSSRNNCQGAGCTDALGNPVAAGTPIQINGGLTEQFTINMALTCTPIVGGAPFPCNGSADLNFQDAFNTNTTPNSQSNVATGTPVLVQVGAATDPSGFLTAGPATGYLVGVSGVQHVVKRGEATTAPDAVGAQVQFLFNVGDLDLNVLSGLGSNYCVGVPKDSPVAPQISAAWNPLGNFNASAVNWEIQDSNHVLAGGSPVSFSSVAGLADCSNGTTCTALPTFTLTNTAPQDGLMQYFVAATITNGTSISTKYFPFYVDVSLTQNYCGAVSSARGGGIRLKGSWSRSAAGFGGPMAMLARPAAKAASTVSTGGTPDVRVSASDVSFTPSLPKAGDTVQVRFRLRNEGDGNAAAVPIALQINGVTVASDTFDVPAGRSVLGGLQWTAPAAGQAAAESLLHRRPPGKTIAADLGEPEEVPANARPLTVRTAAIVVDPQHTQAQKSTLEKSATLAHFGLRSAPAAAAAGTLAGAQRLLIELGEGACVGLRGGAGSIVPCAGTADVELAAEDLSKTLLMLNTMSGVADMGAAFEQTARNASIRFSAQMAALAGHTYAVQLADGSRALLNFESVRNPRELDAQARATFRRNAAARVLKKLGEDSGPQDVGDLTGLGSTPTVFITITVQAP